MIIDSRNRDSRGRTVTPDTTDTDAPTRRRSSNPQTWTKYSKDVDYSISGLGSTRRYKAYPGRTFPMAAAIWRESAAESDRAAKAALKAKADAGKTATGAATSL